MEADSSLTEALFFSNIGINIGYSAIFFSMNDKHNFFGPVLILAPALFLLSAQPIFIRFADEFPYFYDFFRRWKHMQWVFWLPLDIFFYIVWYLDWSLLAAEVFTSGVILGQLYLYYSNDYLDHAYTAHLDALTPESEKMVMCIQSLCDDGSARDPTDCSCPQL